MIIGLSGYARTGKDSVGQHLVDLGFERISFAKPVYDMLYAIDPMIPWPDNVSERYAHTRLSSLVQVYGWEEVKDRFSEVRDLLQRVGTEGGREVIGENVWVDAAMSKLTPGNNYVFTDVRFPNEAEAIQRAGGLVYRLERPGFEAVNAHGSETALDRYRFDAIYLNDGPVENLRVIARSMAGWRLSG